MNYDSNALRTIFASPFDADCWIGLLADLFGARGGLLAKPQPLPKTPGGDCGAYLGAFTTSGGTICGNAANAARGKALPVGAGFAPLCPAWESETR